MRREGGASSKHRLTYWRLIVVKQPSALTGSSAFADDDNRASRPVHGIGQNPAVPVFRVVQVLLAHHRDHALQQWDGGAGLDRALVEDAIAFDALVVVSDLEQLDHLGADIHAFPG